jgi:RsmE family RNA methyltransferase
MNTTCGPVESTLNLVLFTDEDRLDPDHITLRDHRLMHLLQVHRAKIGDRLRVGEVDGLMGEGKILQLNDQAAIVQISLDQAPPPKVPLHLVLALPRPKMLRRILRCVAEFGVAELHLINSYRVEKSYWQSPVLTAEAMDGYLMQGLQQSRDTRIPQVQCHALFKPFVEDTLPHLIEGKRALVAHPGDHPACPNRVNGEALLVIGPEGGFIPYEVEKLARAGCEIVSLGPRILRVENAVAGLLGRLL